MVGHLTAKPISITSNPALRRGRDKVIVSVLDRPVPIPDVKINPRPWNQADRSTMGQTNRILEDRTPDTTAPFTNESSRFETPIHDQPQVTPEVLRRQDYLKWALGAFVLLGVYMVA